MKKYIVENIEKFRKSLGKRNTNIFKNISFSLLLLKITGNSLILHATDDPLSVVNNLSTFIFGLLRGIGTIILVFSAVQIGLSLKAHDPSQRANGFLSFAGGIIITFSKEIIDIITGG